MRRKNILGRDSKCKDPEAGSLKKMAESGERARQEEGDIRSEPDLHIKVAEPGLWLYSE